MRLAIRPRASRQRRDQSDGLSDQGDVGGRTDKATAGNGVPNNESRDNELSCHYEDPAEDTEEQERKAPKHGLKGRSRSTSPKSVTWKREVASPFKTPQECVGHRGTFKAGIGTTDRCLVGDSYPQEHVRLKNRYSTWNVTQGRE